PGSFSRRRLLRGAEDTTWTAWVTRAMIVWSSLFSRTSAWFSLTSSLTCESSVAGVPVPAAASWALVRRRLLVVLGDIGLFPPRLTGGPPPRTVYPDYRCLTGGGASAAPTSKDELTSANRDLRCWNVDPRDRAFGNDIGHPHDCLTGAGVASDGRSGPRLVEGLADRVRIARAADRESYRPGLHNGKQEPGMVMPTRVAASSNGDRLDDDVSSILRLELEAVRVYVHIMS